MLGIVLEAHVVVVVLLWRHHLLHVIRVVAMLDVVVHIVVVVVLGVVIHQVVVVVLRVVFHHVVHA